MPTPEPSSTRLLCGPGTDIGLRSRQQPWRRARRQSLAELFHPRGLGQLTGQSSNRDRPDVRIRPHHSEGSESTSELMPLAGDASGYVFSDRFRVAQAPAIVSTRIPRARLWQKRMCREILKLHLIIGHMESKCPDWLRIVLDTRGT